MALDEPLVKSNDVEKGNYKPTQEELDQEIKDGTMTWNDLVAFFSDPEHWVVTGLFIYAIAMLLALLEYETVDHPMKISFMLKVCAFCIVVLGMAAYTAFLAEQLKVEVDTFRASCAALEEDRARLSDTADTLKESVDKMGDEISKLKEFQTALQSFGDKATGGLKEILDKANASLLTMKAQQKEQVKAILESIAGDIEMQDDTDGMSKEEYEQFKQRLPAKFVNDARFSFEKVSKGKEAIMFDDYQAVIEEVMKEWDGA